LLREFIDAVAGVMLPGSPRAVRGGRGF
jgi:hypothetical protein